MCFELMMLEAQHFIVISYCYCINVLTQTCITATRHDKLHDRLTFSTAVNASKMNEILVINISVAVRIKNSNVNVT